MILRFLLFGLVCAGCAPLALAQEGKWTPEGGPPSPDGSAPRDSEVDQLLRDALGEGPLEVRPELRRRLAALLAAPDWYTRRNAAGVLRRAGAGEFAEPIVAALLREPEPLVAEELVRAVAAFGPAALPCLRARLAVTPAGDARAWLLLCAVSAGDAGESGIAELASLLRANPRAAYQPHGRVALAGSRSWVGARALIELARADGEYGDLWRLADLPDPRLDQVLLDLAGADPRGRGMAIGLLVQRGSPIPEEFLLGVLRGADPQAASPDPAVLALFTAVARRPFAAGMARLLEFALAGSPEASAAAARALSDCWAASSPIVLAGIARHAPGWRAPIEIARPGDEVSTGDARAEGLGPFVDAPTRSGGTLKPGCFALTWRKNSHVWTSAVFAGGMARIVALLDGKTPFADLLRSAGWEAQATERSARLCLTLCAQGLLVWDAPDSCWDPGALGPSLPAEPNDGRWTDPAVVHGFWGE